MRCYYSAAHNVQEIFRNPHKSRTIKHFNRTLLSEEDSAT